MNGLFYWLAMLLLSTTLPALARDRPLKVEPVSGQSQTVLMCPKCSTPIACAKVGDYTVAFSADLLDPIPLGTVRLTVRVTDKTGAPVNVGSVSVAALMSKPGHWHELTPPLKLDRKAAGTYEASTSRLMTGAWRTEVSVTTPTGDTVKQLFTVSLP